MRTIAFIAPFFSENSLKFVRAFAETPEIRFCLISQEPQERLPFELHGKIAAHWRIDNAFDTAQIVNAVRGLETFINGKVERLAGAMEQIQVQLAEARAELGLGGMNTEVAKNFRDKARMKQVFQENNVPCARFRRVSSEADALSFASEVGFPLVLKPLDGAASQSTYQVKDENSLREALRKVAPGAHRQAIIEEFVTGDEYSFETISVKGKPVWHSLTRYYPTPLEVMQNPWIQWCIVLPKEVDDAQFDDIREANNKALRALGIETGLTHLEWFRRRDGSIAISEVAARPPGAQIMTLNSIAHNKDFYKAWVRLRAFDEFEPPTERLFSVGAAFLRGQGKGRHLIVEASLPQIGQPASISYEGEGYIIVRHPETSVVEKTLQKIVSLVRVELG
jgi:biotin carboxylase